MIPNILNGGRVDIVNARLPLLQTEMDNQNIWQYNLWPGEYDSTSVIKSINLSHKQIVKAAKEKAEQEVLIFENDIKFTDAGAFDFYIANKPDEYDLYLGGIFLGEVDEENITKRFSGLTCYMVHSRFYDPFLSTPTNEHLDISLAHLGKYVVCSPFIVTQHNGVSSNTNNYENYDSLFTNRKLFKQNI